MLSEGKGKPLKTSIGLAAKVFWFATVGVAILNWIVAQRVYMSLSLGPGGESAALNALLLALIGAVVQVALLAGMATLMQIAHQIRLELQAQNKHQASVPET